MIDLRDDAHPARREEDARQAAIARPMTPQQKRELAIILISFVVWLPVYLGWVRPVLNAFLFRYINGYPAMLHLVPIFAIPFGLGLGYGKLRALLTRQ